MQLSSEEFKKIISFSPDSSWKMLLTQYKATAQKTDRSLLQPCLKTNSPKLSFGRLWFSLNTQILVSETLLKVFLPLIVNHIPNVLHIYCCQQRWQRRNSSNNAAAFLDCLSTQKWKHFKYQIEVPAAVQLCTSRSLFRSSILYFSSQPTVTSIAWCFSDILPPQFYYLNFKFWSQMVIYTCTPHI